jgi:hypothetical protein
MPEKIDIYRSYGQKLISSLQSSCFRGELLPDRALKAFLLSKQTILRLIDDMRKSYGVEVEEVMNGNRKHFRIRRPGGAPPPLSMTDMEMSTFSCAGICRAPAGPEPL